MRAVVTGANRGIGLDLVRQLLARGGHVDAAVREPERAAELQALGEDSPGGLRVLRCDVGSDASVLAFARAVGDVAVDLLVNNAGVWGGEHQSLGDLDLAEAATTYQVNALGALRVTIALLPNLRRGTGRRILHVTSGMGSIEDNTSGGYYAYRMSKAALNMMSRSMAVDLRRERIASAVINPGWVKTDMGGPGATITTEESVRALLRQVDGLTLEQSGKFLNWRGGECPW